MSVRYRGALTGARLAVLTGLCFLSAGTAVAQDPHSAAPVAGAELRTLERQAASGDAGAQARLGIALALGSGVPRDYQKALPWLRKAAGQGDADAQTILGYMYRDGLGVRTDPKEAARWYLAAARQGQVAAETNLGLMYRDGHGVPQDYAQARAWLSKAAETGEVFAEANLGRLYEEGQAPPDYEAAARWYRKAAEQAHRGAQKKLASLYETGKGVPKDYVTAYMWYAVAGVWDSTGEEPLPADDPRHRLSALMSPEDVAEAQRRAKQWWYEHFHQHIAGPEGAVESAGNGSGKE